MLTKKRIISPRGILVSIVLAALSSVAACGAFSRDTNRRTPADEEGIRERERQLALLGSISPEETVEKLREYCGACHAVGRLRFIWSPDDREVWDYLYAARSPESGKLWVDAITSVLSWPSDEPPDFGKPMDPVNGKDWMPKGSKRLDFAIDKAGELPLRQAMVARLKAGH